MLPHKHLLPHPPVAEGPEDRGSGSCGSLTAGVDAGVAQSFVLVAGRVFLQFSQDFLHAGVLISDFF